MLSEVETIFLPIGTGKHWDFVVLQKDSQGNWQAFRVDTPDDGLCGVHTANQSMQILDSGLTAYANNHPGTVHALSRSNPIQPQIQTALKAVNSPKADAGNVLVDVQSLVSAEHQSQPLRQQTQAALREETEFKAAVTESLKIQRMSPFDYKLVKLAEYEALGYSVENLCKELTQMLVEMAPDNRASAVNRLRLSGLSGKPSIERIIKNSEPASATAAFKLSANRSILMPTPKPGKRIDDEKELNSRVSLKMDSGPRA